MNNDNVREGGEDIVDSQTGPLLGTARHMDVHPNCRSSLVRNPPESDELHSQETCQHGDLNVDGGTNKEAADNSGDSSVGSTRMLLMTHIVMRMIWKSCWAKFPTIV